MAKRVNYRRLAFEHYDPLCPHCGFGIPAVLEVAHLDGNRSNNDLANLVILCPNCHKMHDLDLISTATIIEMRDRPKVVQWSKRMKDAGQKAALKRLRRAAARKAAATRKQRAALDQSIDDVDVEMELLKSNPELMTLLRQLSKEKAAISLEELRKELGL